jgi:hypothetical protein
MSVLLVERKNHKHETLAAVSREKKGTVREGCLVSNIRSLVGTLVDTPVNSDGDANSNTDDDADQDEANQEFDGQSLPGLQLLEPVAFGLCSTSALVLPLPS